MRSYLLILLISFAAVLIRAQDSNDTTTPTTADSNNTETSTLFTDATTGAYTFVSTTGAYTTVQTQAPATAPSTVAQAGSTNTPTYTASTTVINGGQKTELTKVITLSAIFIAANMFV